MKVIEKCNTEDERFEVKVCLCYYNARINSTHEVATQECIKTFPILGTKPEAANEVTSLYNGVYKGKVEAISALHAYNNKESKEYIKMCSDKDPEQCSSSSEILVAALSRKLLNGDTLCQL